MKKVPSKQHIAELANILKQKGANHVIICPGSRNAPLIQVFERDDEFDCFSIVDERSAAYVALGMAKESGKPSVVVTTSGTAVLNLGPAVAEANNQGIPLILLTGDRPDEYPPQFTNQKINQEQIFPGNAAGSFSLPEKIEDEDHLDEIMSGIAAQIDEACFVKKGPLHINIPLLDPLYEEIPKDSLLGNKHDVEEPKTKTADHFSPSDAEKIIESLEQGRKILILAGTGEYPEFLQQSLSTLVSNYQVTVVAEHLANLPATFTIGLPELLLTGRSEETRKALEPDLVITMGSHIVSKQLRLFVQGLNNVPVIVTNRLGAESYRLRADSFGFLPSPEKKNIEQENTYFPIWKKEQDQAIEKANRFVNHTGFNNLTVIKTILEKVPGGTTIHLGNSAVVRYSQLFPSRGDLKYMSNRGTSGIDGCISTAVGAALVSSHQHLAIVGDLSFVYDSNALWNRNFPGNLQIVVINDKGGGIFRLLNGPDRMSFFDEFSVTHHPVSFWHLVKAFDLNILQANEDYTLDDAIKKLFSTGSKFSVFEIETAESENAIVFRQYYESVKS